MAKTIKVSRYNLIIIEIFKIIILLDIIFFFLNLIINILTFIIVCVYVCMYACACACVLLGWIRLMLEILASRGDQN